MSFWLSVLWFLLAFVLLAAWITHSDRRRRASPPSGWDTYMADRMRQSRQTDWLDQQGRAVWLLNAYHWNGLAVPDKADLPPVIREEFDRAEQLKERIGTE